MLFAVFTLLASVPSARNAVMQNDGELRMSAGEDLSARKRGHIHRCSVAVLLRSVDAAQHQICSVSGYKKAFGQVSGLHWVVQGFGSQQRISDVEPEP